ncbi:hypothetical protein BD413DRAFT_589218 [Trametes elegans]|nr:hypothetical protein BD413DRAFT_589218 [Trametes elegans]
MDSRVCCAFCAASAGEILNGTWTLRCASVRAREAAGGGDVPWCPPEPPAQQPFAQCVLRLPRGKMEGRPWRRLVVRRVPEGGGAGKSRARSLCHHKLPRARGLRRFRLNPPYVHIVAARAALRASGVRRDVGELGLDDSDELCEHDSAVGGDGHGFVDGARRVCHDHVFVLLVNAGSGGFENPPACQRPWQV